MDNINEIKDIIDKLPKEDQDYYRDMIRNKQRRIEKDRKTDSEIVSLAESVERSSSLSKEQNDSIVEAINSITMPEVVKVEETNPKESIEVENLKDIKFPKFPKFPPSIAIKKPSWINTIVKKLIGAIPKGPFKADLDDYTDADNPLAVRLSDGKKFINQIIAAGGNIINRMPLPFTTSLTSGGIESRGLVDNDGHQQIDIIIPKDYYFEVAEGNVPGRGFVHKFGRNPNIPNAAGTFEAIWNGGDFYTGFNCIVAETLETFSGSGLDAGTLVTSGTITSATTSTLTDTNATFITDSVAIGDIILDDTELIHGVITDVTSETVLTVYRWDDGSTFAVIPLTASAYRIATPASSGASVVHLKTLLDGNLANETSEFIILNGVTPVDTVGTYMRHPRASILQAGSGGVNVGAITTRQKTTTANITMVMPVGYNQTMIAAYTVPTDREGHLTSWYSGLAGKASATCNIRLNIRHPGEVFGVQEEFSIIGGGTSYVQREYRAPKNSIHPGSDIYVSADSDTNNTGVAAGFDLILSTD